MNGNAALSEACQQALQMPEILERVLQLCSMKDLTTCRQVCTFWNKLSFTKWRASIMVKLESPEKMAGVLDLVRQTTAGICFAHYILRGHYPKDISDPFWAVCGDYMTYLELNNYQFHNAEDFRNVIFTWTPNLQELVLLNPKEKDAEWVVKPSSYMEPSFGENLNQRSLTIQLGGLMGDWCMELLSNFPGRKTLNLTGLAGIQYPIFASIVEIRRRHPEQLMLTEIFALNGDIGSYWVDWEHWVIGSPMLEALVDTGLQLEILSLGVNIEPGFGRLERIVNANMSSLRKLHLNRLPQQFGEVAGRIPIHCQLDNLTDLAVHHELVASFEFLKFTPNLIRFAITDDRDEEVARRMLPQSHSLELLGVQLTRCKEFKYTSQLSVKELNQFIKWFPNMQRLALRLDNDTFRLVCEHWRNLTSLEIASGSQVDEYGLTGMNAEDVDLINIERLVPFAVKRPNLTYLKYLRHLKICAKPEWNVSLDYCGITFGVKQFPNLCTFDATGYIYRITEHLWNELQERFQFRGQASEVPDAYMTAFLHLSKLNLI